MGDIARNWKSFLQLLRKHAGRDVVVGYIALLLGVFLVGWKVFANLVLGITPKNADW